MRRQPKFLLTLQPDIPSICHDFALKMAANSDSFFSENGNASTGHFTPIKKSLPRKEFETDSELVSASDLFAIPLAVVLAIGMLVTLPFWTLVLLFVDRD